MSFRKKNTKNGFVAQLVNGDEIPCVFCNRKVNDEILYGKLYSIGDIQCHYFCVLLSCCLVQNGNDDEGLLGFLYTDILAEVERSKKHKCSYCGKGGATLGCSVSKCRKQFHVPCGQEMRAVSMFYGNYKSYCEIHAPKQDIPDSIMVKVKERLALRKKKLNITKRNCANEIQEFLESDPESVCAICYEEVDGFPTTRTFWPPCCARDEWFHRTCLQRMVLNAGMHYVKCPLCNDKDIFFQEVVSQGYYVPDRDAAWELEQNAFADIYVRPVTCSAKDCHCPMGRNHDSESGMWDVKLCLLCGSSGAHAQCLLAVGSDEQRFICEVCKPAAPANIDTLETAIAAVIQEEQEREATNSRSGPIMPARMSLRRTRRQRQCPQRYTSASTRTLNRSTTTTSNLITNKEENEVTCIDKKEITQDASPSNTELSRAELNITCPRRLEAKQLALSQVENKILSPVKFNAEDSTFSPVKLLEKELVAKVKRMGVKHTIVLNNSIMEELRRKFSRPKPLSHKRKMINVITDQLIENLLSEHNIKKPTTGWNSSLKKWESSSNEASPKIPKQASVLRLFLQQDQGSTGVSPRKSPNVNKTSLTPGKSPNTRKTLTPSKSPNLQKTPKNSPRLVIKINSSESPLQKEKLNEKSPKSEKVLNLDKCYLDLTTPKKRQSCDQKQLQTPDQQVIGDSSKANQCDLTGTALKTEKAMKLEKIIMQLSTPKKKDHEIKVNVKTPNTLLKENHTSNQKSLSTTAKAMAVTQQLSLTPLKSAKNVPVQRLSKRKRSKKKKKQTAKDLKKSVSFKFFRSRKDSKSTETFDATHADEKENSELSHFFSQNNHDSSQSIFKIDCDEHNNAHDVLVIDDIDDESSTSTFQLPSEFIADTLSDESFSILETPKKLKTVDIQKDSSMEISEHDEVVNIDLVTIKNNSPGKNLFEKNAMKSPEKTIKCAFKVNPVDKEALQNKKIDIDLESFKNQYLNEIGKQNAKNDTPIKAVRFSTDTIDNEKTPTLKRKIEMKSKQPTKKRKPKRKNTDEQNIVLKYDTSKVESGTITISDEDEKPKTKSKKLRRKKLRKAQSSRNTKISIDKNIHVKIKWKKKELNVKITKSKTKRRKKKGLKDTSLKQYILHFKPDMKALHSPTKMVLARPENDVKLSPLKKKKIKQDNSPDNLVQTSIQNFFKLTSPLKF